MDGARERKKGKNIASRRSSIGIASATVITCMICHVVYYTPATPRHRVRPRERYIESNVNSLGARYRSLRNAAARSYTQKPSRLVLPERDAARRRSIRYTLYTLYICTLHAIYTRIGHLLSGVARSFSRRCWLVTSEVNSISFSSVPAPPPPLHPTKTRNNEIFLCFQKKTTTTTTATQLAVIKPPRARRCSYPHYRGLYTYAEGETRKWREFSQNFSFN